MKIYVFQTNKDKKERNKQLKIPRLLNIERLVVATGHTREGNEELTCCDEHRVMDGIVEHLYCMPDANTTLC